MPCAWDVLDEKEVMEFAEKYRNFLSECKTEFETVEKSIESAEKNGFRNMEHVERLESGDKVYWNFRDRMCFFAKIGEKKERCRIICAHCDSPRIELKVNPVEEKKDANLGVFKLAYYGGTHAYIWLNRALELRGVIYREGEKIRVHIPGIIISDLLPHLSGKRMEERKAKEIVRWEELKALAANRAGEKKDFKKAIYEILSERIGIKIGERDFVRAHLYLVPEEPVKDAGIDKSMLAGYGHDDRACCFASLMALMHGENFPENCAVIFVDREEIGSESFSSAKSECVKFFFEMLAEKANLRISLRRLLIDSNGISADVTTALQPGFEDCFDVQNAPVLGNGVAIERYLATAGKYQQNEASAKYVDYLISVLEKRNIPWQGVVGFSKTDPSLGGGGTISGFMGRLGMNVIDAGIPVIGMHTPMEIISKADLYACYLAYKAFFEE